LNSRNSTLTTRDITFIDTNNDFVSQIDNGYGYTEPTLNLNDNSTSLQMELNTRKLVFYDNNTSFNTEYKSDGIEFPNSIYKIGNSTLNPSIQMDGANGNVNIEGTGVCSIGDQSGAGSGLTIYVDNTNSSVTIDSRGGISQMGDVNSSQHFTKMTLDDSIYNINLDTINLTANNNSYTYPICFTYKATGSVSYGSAGSFQDVFHASINFPSFVMDTNTLPQYASWKIEFALNCRNMSDQTNKELAIYFELEDTTTAIYTPFLFNSTTPYTNHKNGSTYPNTPNSENYTWSDYVDLSGVNSAVPLMFRLYWFANSSNNFDFNLIVSFTKTNILS
jgi:hypothetical protein